MSYFGVVLQVSFQNQYDDSVCKHAFSLFVVLTIKAQNTPFDIQLTPIQSGRCRWITNLAFGQHEGKWLIIGGRLDGLHRRQPFASFDVAGHNTQLNVVDPVGNQSWTASLDVLPASISAA
ncbi:MAG: hypothetical protein IPN89_19030 [Saprospiraceae bacterium]|nr:hypothetical protein [Saprospiraceae bacterium]